MTQAVRRNLEKLVTVAAKIYRTQRTGRLICSAKQFRWSLYFDQGRLVWLTDNRNHRIRRWLRLSRGIVSPQTRYQASQQGANTALWESDALGQQVREAHIDASKAQALLQRAVTETLFAMGDYDPMQMRWQEGEIAVPNGALTLPEQCFRLGVQNALRLQQAWASVGVPRQRAYDGLVLNQERLAKDAGGGSPSILSLQPLFTSDRNFWDLLSHFPESPTIAIRIVQHFCQQGILSFKPIGDRALPDALPGAKPPSRRATILCIDDSPASTEALKQHCKAQNIEAVVCNDPLQAIPMAIQHQPDLILLDLVMPIVNGHEICAQLRRVTELQDTPIVMLTSKGGLGDRVRSKMVKASGFIAKPITAQKLRDVIEQHLPHLADRQAPPQKTSQNAQPGDIPGTVSG